MNRRDITELGWLLFAFGVGSGVDHIVRASFDGPLLTGVALIVLGYTFTAAVLIWRLRRLAGERSRV